MNWRKKRKPTFTLEEIDAAIASRQPMSPDAHFARRRKLVSGYTFKDEFELLVLEREFDLWWKYGVRRNWPMNQEDA